MKYYKARLVYSEEGMQVVFDILHSIHETQCYSYCLNRWNLTNGEVHPPLKREGESNFKAAKRLKYKIIRIHKGSSRIAFETKEKAFEQLLFLKRRQIGHMKREIDLLTYFLERVKDTGLATLEHEKSYCGDGPQLYTLKESTDKLLEYYHFD